MAMATFTLEMEKLRYEKTCCRLFVILLILTFQNRWINLRRSLYRMFNYLPSGVELGVISYTNSSSLSLPLTVASTHNRDHLHRRIPVRPLTTESDESCISCALRAAVKVCVI